jgi:hypothetical protein
MKILTPTELATIYDSSTKKREDFVKAVYSINPLEVIELPLQPCKSSSNHTNQSKPVKLVATYLGNGTGGREIEVSIQKKDLLVSLGDFVILESDYKEIVK